jgi:ankyrin repeat protein
MIMSTVRVSLPLAPRREKLSRMLDEGGAEIIQRSGLPSEELGELWNHALEAEVFSTTLPAVDVRVGFMTKQEFFILLAEVQKKLRISPVDLFEKLYVEPPAPPPPEVASPTMRSNPFGRSSSSQVASPNPQISSPQLSSPEISTPQISSQIPSPQVEAPPSADVESATFDLQVAAIANTLAASPGDDDSLYVSATKEIGYLHLDSSEESLPPEQNDTSAAPLEPQRDDEDDWEPLPPPTPPGGVPKLSRRLERPIEEPPVSHPVMWASDDPQVQALEVLETLRLLYHIDDEDDSAPTISRRTSRALFWKKKDKTRDKNKTRSAEPTNTYADFMLSMALDEAAAAGNVPLMRVLIDDFGANVASPSPPSKSMRGKGGYDALSLAVSNRHDEAVNFLLNNGVTTQQTHRALVEACSHGRLFIAELLLSSLGKEIYPNLSDVEAYEPTASGWGSFWLTKVDVPAPSGVTPSAFNALCYVQDLNMRMELLEVLMARNDFDPDKVVLQTFHYFESGYHVGDDYRICIEWTAAALFAHFLWKEGLLAMINSGVRLHGGHSRSRSRSIKYNWDPNIMDNSSHSPAHFHVLDQLLPPMFMLPKKFDSEADFLDICSTLVDAGALPHLQYSDWGFGSNFRQPLIASISMQSPAVVKLLLHNGADAETIDQPDDPSSKNTALGVAMSKNSQEILQLLIDAGAQTDQPGWRGRSPLSLACYYGHVGNVQFLLNLNPLIKSTEAADCVKTSVQYGHFEIVQTLLEAGAMADERAMSAAVKLQAPERLRSDYFPLIELLLSHGSAVDAYHIVQAIDADNYDVLQHILHVTMGTPMLLVFRETTVLCDMMKKPPPGKRRITPLAYATYLGKRDFVRLLQAHGFSG